jgi:hypothetical protein
LLKGQGSSKSEAEVAAEMDEALLHQKISTSAAVASRLSIWKDDVHRLLEIVATHITRCGRLRDHEVRASHQSVDTPVDTRRKRLNEFVLGLKADLRALLFFLTANASVEEHEVPESERPRALDAGDRPHPIGTKYASPPDRASEASARKNWRARKN